MPLREMWIASASVPVNRAEALSVAQGYGEVREGEVGQIFERWETRIAESEIASGCDGVAVDTFDAEFTNAEEDSALRLELRALKRLAEPAPAEASASTSSTSADHSAPQSIHLDSGAIVGIVFGTLGLLVAMLGTWYTRKQYKLKLSSQRHRRSRT